MADFLYTTVKWLWDNYGKEAIGRLSKDSKKQWDKFNWPQAEAKYRSRLRELYGTTKILYRDIQIQNLYTDVFVQDRISANIYLDAAEFQAHVIGKKSFAIQQTRKPIQEIALQSKRLFILGKPGSGKTTFLKYLTLQACMNNINKTPVFINLKEWSDSGLKIAEYINKQFDVCSFPNPESFIEQLLNGGSALVLCDGLDEVDIKKRDSIIEQLEWFSRKYIDTHICISCRLGSIDKEFDRFSYVEIADFDEKQITIFIRKWFKGENKKVLTFLEKLHAPENQGLKEISQTPLLLALLCIFFEENLEFPRKKIDLYKGSIDVLLEKWDAKRGITRSNEHFALSRSRKENLLGYLAAINFESSRFVFEKDLIAQQAETFLKQLPADETMSTSGELILKAIQEHHGLIVERSHNLLSFSHLTFQEYFTAKYIIGNAANGSINRLIATYWNNDQWHEIIKMTFGMLDDGTEPIHFFVKHVNSVLKKERNLELLFRWSSEKAAHCELDAIPARCLYAYLGLIIAGSRTPDYARYAARARDKLQSFSYSFGEVSRLKFLYKRLEDVALELS